MTCSISLLRRSGGRGLKSIESEYKITKIKAATRLNANANPTMGLVRRFEEKAERTGRRSLVEDEQKYAKELGMKLELPFPDPSGTTVENEKIEGRKIGMWTKRPFKTSTVKAQDNRDGRESSIQDIGKIKILMVRVSSGFQTGKQHRRTQ